MSNFQQKTTIPSSSINLADHSSPPPLKNNYKQIITRTDILPNCIKPHKKIVSRNLRLLEMASKAITGFRKKGTETKGPVRDVAADGITTRSWQAVSPFGTIPTASA